MPRRIGLVMALGWMLLAPLLAAQPVRYHWLSPDTVLVWASDTDTVAVRAGYDSGAETWALDPPGALGAPAWQAAWQAAPLTPTPSDTVRWVLGLERLRTRPEASWARPRLPDVEIYVLDRAPDDAVVYLLGDGGSYTFRFRKDEVGVWQKEAPAGEALRVLFGLSTINDNPIVPRLFPAAEATAPSDEATWNARWNAWLSALEPGRRRHFTYALPGAPRTRWVWTERLAEQAFLRRARRRQAAGVTADATTAARSAAAPWLAQPLLGLPRWLVLLTLLDIFLVGLWIWWRQRSTAAPRAETPPGTPPDALPATLPPLGEANQHATDALIDRVRYVAAGAEEQASRTNNDGTLATEEVYGVLRELQANTDLLTLGALARDAFETYARTPDETSTAAPNWLPDRAEERPYAWLSRLFTDVLPTLDAARRERHQLEAELTALRQQQDTHARERAAQQARLDELEALRQRHDEEIEQLRRDCEQRVAALAAEHAEVQARLEESVAQDRQRLGQVQGLRVLAQEVRRGEQAFLDQHEDFFLQAALFALTRYALNGLALARADGDERRAAAFYVSLATIARKLHHYRGTPLSGFQAVSEALAPGLPAMERLVATMERAEQGHAGSKLIQSMLKYLRDQARLDLLPYYYEVDNQGRLYGFG